jgi:hypothetical protein
MHVGKIAAGLLLGVTGLALVIGTVRMVRSFSGPHQPTAVFEYAPDCLAPGGRLVATPFVLSGGGAAGFVDYFVSIRNTGDTLDPTAGVPLYGRPPGRVRWQDSLTLELHVVRPEPRDSADTIVGINPPVVLRYVRLDSTAAAEGFCATEPQITAGERTFPCGIGQRCR